MKSTLFALAVVTIFSVKPGIASDRTLRPVRIIDMSAGTPEMVADVNRAPSDELAPVEASLGKLARPGSSKTLNLKGRVFHIQETIR